MIATFNLKLFQVRFGSPLKVGDTIEYPFRTGSVWTVREIDEKANSLVLESA